MLFDIVFKERHDDEENANRKGTSQRTNKKHIMRFGSNVAPEDFENKRMSVFPTASGSKDMTILEGARRKKEKDASLKRKIGRDVVQLR